MSAVRQHDIEHVAPLNGLQQSMLFRSLAEPNSGHYIEQLSFEFNNFNPQAMQASLDAVIATRWAMRTSFLWREQSTPKQLTFREAHRPIEFKTINSDHCGRLSDDSKRQVIAEDRARGLSLGEAPLMRMTVFTPEEAMPNTGQRTAFCIWTFHHAIVDGWSIALLQHELLAYYQAFRHGISPNLPAADTAAAKSKPPAQKDLGHWAQQLQDASTDSVLDFLPGHIGKQRLYLDVEYSDETRLVERIRASCQRYRVTFANIAHAAWALLLCHLNGRETVLYGTIDSGRSDLKNGETAVGMLMQLLPVRIDIDESTPLGPFLQELQRKQWSLNNDRLPSPADMALALHRAPGDELFDALLLVQNYPVPDFPDDIGLLEYKGFEQADAPLVLSVGITDKLSMLARVQTDRVNAAQARLLQACFAKMLDLVAGATETQTLGGLLDQFAGTSVPSAGITQHTTAPQTRCIDRFAAIVQDCPNKTALIDANASYTYAALASRAEEIREQLEHAGVTDQSVVGVLLPRCVNSVASCVAILAQGASYVPIDPAFPASTVQAMLADSNANCVITASKGSFNSADTSIQVLPLPLAEGAASKQLSVCSSKNDIMCVQFTSGSTGRAKGVTLSHTAIMNRLLWMERCYPFAEAEACAARTPVNFVDSVAEVFGPLCAGVSCRIIDDAELFSMSKFINIVEQCGITRLTLVPSLLDALLSELRQTNQWSKVRLCIVSGEALSPRLVKGFHNAMPNCRLLNLYGSTEVAADAMCYVTSAADSEDQQWVPIGEPIDNLSARVCNSIGRPLPRGIIGELRIGGLGVTKGYINDQQLTAQKFVDGYFLSGDLAFQDDNALFHYRGRSDRQVKLRGQRVEPGAIETTLARHPKIRQAVVVLSDHHLVCFYTGEHVASTVLMEFMGSTLPSYSVPARYRQIDEIPLTQNGKIDYRVLQQMTAAASANEDNDKEAVSLSLHQKELGLTIGNIWSELLPNSVISTNTDFFEAGGHSLLAMQMIASVERALGLNVPLAVFMRNTRLADFAKVLFEGIPKLSAPELITLRDGDGSAAALFCIQGDAYNIVPHCQIDRKIYWISQWSICVDLTRDPQPVPEESIQETAERYAKHIERVHPEGELCLLAACGAAVISIEIARILERQGRPPSKLVLMDLPRGELTTASERGFKHRQGRNILHSAYGYAMRVGGGNKIKAYFDRNKIYRKINRGIALSDAEAAELMHIRLSDALGNYEPEEYPGQVELILSKAWYRGVAKEEDAKVPDFWKPFLPNVSAIHFSPAEHHSDLLQGAAAAFAVNVIEN